MTLRNHLLLNPYLEFKDNIFYQKDFAPKNPFEEIYIKVRDKENRVYSDDVVRALPNFNGSATYQKEWRLRKKSAEQLIKQLTATKVTSILEVGCGNGWLANNLAFNLNAEICAVDINKSELLQGARVFREPRNLLFVYADIFSPALEKEKFDTIILSACIQYFKDLKNLLSRLLELLNTEGRIYILDSPIYASAPDAAAARKRSQRYFESLGFPEMVERYLHHTFQELNDFNCKVLYSPKSLRTLFQRKILQSELPIFPMVSISTK
jgi:ubiquinone/menaquinone biosynthesis C-methylase UbiE